MLAVRRHAERRPRRCASRRAPAYDVEWVDIDEPDPSFPYTPARRHRRRTTRRSSFVGQQGRRQGRRRLLATRRRVLRQRHRLLHVDAGRWSGRDADSGTDRRRMGQRQRAGVGVPHPQPAAEADRSSRPAPSALDFPDNVTVSKRRHHRAVRGQRPMTTIIRGLTRDGRLFDIALNRLVEQSTGAPRFGDEFAGATFSPDGHTLVRQHPGQPRHDVRDLGPVGARSASDRAVARSRLSIAAGSSRQTRGMRLATIRTGGTTRAVAGRRRRRGRDRPSLRRRTAQGIRLARRRRSRRPGRPTPSTRSTSPRSSRGRRRRSASGSTTSTTSPRPGARHPSTRRCSRSTPASLIGAYDPIQMPHDDESTEIDWEAELGVVIGTEIRRGSSEQAAAAIAGYTVVNDISVRDYQYRTHAVPAGQGMGGQHAGRPVPRHDRAGRAGRLPDQLHRRRSGDAGLEHDRSCASDRSSWCSTSRP